MEHITVGRTHNTGKIAYIECLKNSALDNINIKDECFLLVCLVNGVLSFETDGNIVSAGAPSFICFSEHEEPRILTNNGAEYYCIYFHPKFLNINMSFELLRSREYTDIAFTHDMFLLRPFIDGFHVVPISENYIEPVSYACTQLGRELAEQRDWYWSCRGRSYFMEVIIALERMYGLIGYGDKQKDSTAAIDNHKLREAVLYIEGHYMKPLTLSAIGDAVGLNHTTLTRLMKDCLGMTTMEYLMNYRISVSKKQLEFTEIPIKEVAFRSGFKTVQHFNRVFKLHTDMTPADFRKEAVSKRKREIKR